MADESDGIEEVLEGQLRLLVTAAGQIGERIARVREEALRRAQASSEQETRELTSRLAAEQRAARTELAGVYRSDWWDRATPEQIGHTYQVARAWSGEDPEAMRAEARMRDELRTRYGVDVANADPAVAVRAAAERAEQDRALAEAARTRAAAESVEAQMLVQQADRDDARAEQARAAIEHGSDADERALADIAARAAQASLDTATGHTPPGEADAGHDSAARREATATRLRSAGLEPAAVDTLMRADISQAKPATEATRNADARRPNAPKARRAPGRRTQTERGEIGR